MPFDRIPGGNINTSSFEAARPQPIPARPQVPMWEVVMKALDKILPELDPLERAKKRLAMESIPIEKLKLQAEKENLPLATRAAKLRLAILEDEFNRAHGAGVHYKGQMDKVDALAPPSDDNAETPTTELPGDRERQPYDESPLFPSQRNSSSATPDQFRGLENSGIENESMT